MLWIKIANSQWRQSLKDRGASEHNLRHNLPPFSSSRCHLLLLHWQLVTPLQGLWILFHFIGWITTAPGRVSSPILSTPNIALFPIAFLLSLFWTFFLVFFFTSFPLSVDSSHKVLSHSVFTSLFQVISAKGILDFTKWRFQTNPSSD